MYKNISIFMGAALFLTVGCVDMDSEIGFSEQAIAVDQAGAGADVEAVTGVSAEALEEMAAYMAEVDANRQMDVAYSAGATVLDFEDIRDTSGYHTMAGHNPYHGVTFSTQLYHYSYGYYGQPHSGRTFLFNAWGYDNQSLNFDAPVTFEGLWVGEPHSSTKTFWLEGYRNGVKVGESAHITLNRRYWAPRWLEADFGVPVDKVVLRRSGYYYSDLWYVIDDIVFHEANESPIADAGPDQRVECAGAETAVTLDGSGSYDPDGSIVDYSWSEGGAAIASGVSPTVNLDHALHTITLTVTDDYGDSASDDVTVDVIDSTAPAIDLELSTDTLWPPNHDMQLVASGVGASDVCDSNIAVNVSISSNEPIDGLGDGSSSPDWEIVANDDGTFDVWVRAERSGKGDGRVYTITVTATDSSGNSSTASADVTVAHDRR